MPVSHLIAVILQLKFGKDDTRQVVQEGRQYKYEQNISDKTLSLADKSITRCTG